jgi:hypothetical protein
MKTENVELQLAEDERLCQPRERERGEGREREKREDRRNLREADGVELSKIEEDDWSDNASQKSGKRVETSSIFRR